MTALIASVPALQAASTQTMPSKNIIEMPSQPGKADSAKPGTLQTESQSMTGAKNKNGPATEPQVTADLEAGFSVDPVTGSPRLTLPIEIAKGTNLTPDLALSFDGRMATSDPGSAWWITGAEAITNCAETDGLCVGGFKLTPVQGARDGSLYRLANDPLTLLRQTKSGYVISTPSGETRTYTSASRNGGDWRLDRVTDPYGSFISYSYLAETNWPVTITYGAKGTSDVDLRKVNFTYDLKTPGKLTNITSTIGRQTVRNYALSYDSHGQLTKLTDCGTAASQSADCKIAYQFSWLTSGTSVPVLHQAKNSLGGVVDVNYLPGSEGSVVSSQTSSAGGTAVSQIQYFYGKPITGKSGKISGFEQVVSYNPIDDIGVISSFGTGNLAGRILSAGSFNLKGKTFSFTDMQPNYKQIYSYLTTKTSAGPVALLSKKENAVLEENGNYKTLQTVSYEYDSKGRIVSLAEGDTETKTTYLNNDIYLDLVASRDFVNLKTKTTERTIEWAYKFDNGAISQATISVDDMLDTAGKAVGVFKYDIYGNVVSIAIGKNQTSFTYDTDFHSFPTNITWNLEGGTKRWSNFTYDPATGEILRLENEIGNVVTTTLDEFGEARSIVTTTKLPQENSNDSPSAITETTENLEAVNQDGNMVLTKKRSLSTDTGSTPYFSTIQTSVIDGMGRMLKIDTETQSGSEAAVKSTITKKYGEKSVSTAFTLPDGTSMEQEHDRYGRLIRQKDQVRGEFVYAYSASGLVSSITRNGQKVTFEYDDQGRIKSRLLPDGGKYGYTYDELFTQRPATVTLPDGSKISYEYYTDGSRKSKAVTLNGPDNQSYEFKTQFTYKNNQLKSITYPDGSEVTYNYDGPTLMDISWAKGAPKTLVDGNNSIVSYDSSVENGVNLVLVRKLNNGVIDRRTWNYAGQLSHLTTIGANGKTLLDLDYGIDDEMTRINRSNRLQGDQSLAKRYQYDDQAQLAAIESQVYKTEEKSNFNENKQTESFTYGDAGSLLTDEAGLRSYKLDNTQNYRPLSRSDGMKFTYAANGNLIRKATRNSVSEFEFDALSQLRKATVTTIGKKITTSMTYDNTGERLFKSVEGESTTAYIDRFYEVTWNADGTVQQTKYVPDPVMIVASYTETLSKKEMQQFIPAVTKASGGANDTGMMLLADLTSSVQTTLVETKLWILSNVPANLIAASPLALIALVTGIMLLAFDAFLRRYLVQDETEEYPIVLGDTNQGNTGFSRKHAVMAAVAPLVIFSFLFSSLVPTVQAAVLDGRGIPQPNSANYYHESANGSMLLVTNSKGEARASVDYSAYGFINNNALTSGKDSFRRKFARMEYDKSIGIYYDHARYYDPDIGRFISPDPSNASDDPYNYAGSDPINFFDPDGRMIDGNEDLNTDNVIGQTDMDIINEPGNYGSRTLNPYRQLLEDHQQESGITDYEADYFEADVDENETIQNYTFVPPTFWRFWWKYKRKISSVLSGPTQVTPLQVEDNTQELLTSNINPAQPPSSELGVLPSSQSLLSPQQPTNVTENRESDEEENKDVSLSDEEEDLEEVNLDENEPVLDVFMDEDKILFNLLREIKYSIDNDDNRYLIDQNIINLVKNDEYLSITELEERHNKLARRTVKSFSSTGVLMFTMIAPLLSAYFWPYYNPYEDDPQKKYCNGGDFSWPCYLKESLINIGVVLIFSGVAKTYYYLEAAYWGANALSTRTDETGCCCCKKQGALIKTAKKATVKDYVSFSVRRLLFAVGSQLIGFNLLGIVSQQLRFGVMLTGSQLFWLNIGWLTTSVAGNIAWLPIFMMLRNPSNDTERDLKNKKARELDLENSEYKNSNWADRFTFQYRQFLFGKHNLGTGQNWLDLSESNFQYLLRSLQFYLQYNFANISFYGGYTTAILIDKNLDFAFWAYVLKANILRANLAVNSSIFSYIQKIKIPLHCTTLRLDKSFTIQKKRTPNNPRGICDPLRLFVGPYDGIRIFQYDDTSYLPEQLWKPKLKQMEIHRLKVLLRQYYKENPMRNNELRGISVGSSSSGDNSYQLIPDQKENEPISSNVNPSKTAPSKVTKSKSSNIKPTTSNTPLLEQNLRE